MGTIIKTTVKDKVKESSTLAVVIFAMAFLTVNAVLQFIGVKVDYMGSLVDKSFYIFMIYIGGNKAKDAIKGKK